jgi:membrane-associated phospholipid phosphatase
MTSHRCQRWTRGPRRNRQAALRRLLTFFGLLALIVALGVVASAAQAGSANGLGRTSVESASSAGSNVVIDWNQRLVDALLFAHTPPQPGTRIGAIVETSVFDAVNGIKAQYTQFRPEVVTTDAPRGASAPAAAAGAAYTALVAFFPAQKATFDAQLAATLATLSDDEGSTSPPVSRGLAWGQTVANAILAWRSADGFTATLPAYIVQPLPSWQPTPLAFAPPAWRQFGAMTPWAMTSPGEFLPAPPPALTSARYAQDFNEVKTIGTAATSTPELIATARFWGGQFDTVATIWNRVAESLAANERMSLVENARFFALLNSSMADAVIAVWNAKNAYNTWRPITAIQNADVDGNADTTLAPAWAPVLITPAFQEYPSGHSGVSTAAATVLASFFGNHTTFSVSSDGVPDEPRTYSSFSDVVDEVALARIAGGIHFRFACDAAQKMGQAIADHNIATEFRPLNGNH